MMTYIYKDHTLTLDEGSIFFMALEDALRLDVAEGILRGCVKYGPLEVETDKRNFIKEALEEMRDGFVYTGAAILQKDTPARRAALEAIEQAFLAVKRCETEEMVSKQPRPKGRGFVG